jgi:hypothetical protein
MGNAYPPCEAIKHTTGGQEDGAEYWSARELGEVVGYTRWENFTRPVKRAMTACETSGNALSDHLHDSMKMISTGKGATRDGADYDLSRYACYLIVQNGDPEKPAIAAGQDIFRRAHTRGGTDQRSARARYGRGSTAPPRALAADSIGL